MKKSNIVLFVFSVIISLLFAEFVLRITGTHPGFIKSFDGFTIVDNLRVYKNFATDEAGIYKFSPWVTDSLLKYFDCDTRENTNPEIEKVLYDGDKVYYIYECFCKQTKTPKFSLYWSLLEYMNGGDADTNCLVETHHRILQNQVTADEIWKGAFMEYFSRPFNQDGFRSIPFKNYATKQLKVLVIGDSFVYGMDAHPQQNSFVDLLLSRGYLVYAAGIPGTDPAQYAAIAKKYIPILKPDVVVSCLYTGNDFMKYAREPDAHRPHEHMTNAGLFTSNPYGKYLSAEEGYRFYVSLSTFPDSTNRLFDRICSYTSIGSLVWNFLYNKGMVSHVSQKFYSNESMIPADSIYARTKVYTKRIQSICQNDSIPFIQAVIPELDVRPVDTSVLSFLFDGQYSIPQNLDAQTDYYKRAIHFNNNGAYKYANFLDSLLKPYARAKALTFATKIL